MRRRIAVIMLLAALGCVLGLQVLIAADEKVIENVDFFEADLRDVLRSLGVAGGFNVLLTREVQGSVTISLHQSMTVRDAIELVARTHEYDLHWLKDNRTVIIGPKSKLQTNFDLQESRVFTLYYSTVAEIAEALKVVVEPKQISTNPRTNQITVYGTALQLENAEEIISQMDHPMPQVNIEARMEEVAEDNLDELGLTWSSSLDFGLGPGFSIVSYPQVSATLKALENKNLAQLLAQPNASCLDSQEATIFVGDRYPITVTNIVEGQTQYSTQYVEIGTKLTVKPRVNLNDIVTVYIKAEVSNITSYTKNANGDEMPVIRTRQTESTTKLRNGQTFVLTGLIQRDEITSKTAVPFLSRLPILSALFKNKKVQAKKTVICIFLTPHLQKVTPDEIPSASARANIATPAVPAPAAPPAGDADAAGSAAPPAGGQEQPSAPPVPEAPPVTAAPPEDVNQGQTQAQPAVEPVPADEPAPAGVEPNTAAPAAPGQEPEPPVGDETTGTLPQPQQPASAEPAVVVPGEAQAPPRVLPGPDEIRYVPYLIKKGDTLSSIARKYGISWQEIASYNNMTDKPMLRPGQTLLIPIPDNHKYVVKAKETLWRIAKRYGVSWELLAEINSLADPAKLEVGQVIILPCTVDQIVNPDY